MQRRTPLRRSWIRWRPRATSYARRDRDLEHMKLVKRLACSVRVDPPDPSRLTTCRGRVEADHMGSRGLGQKSDDRETAPLCEQHHLERTTHSGAFAALTRDEARSWKTRQVERTVLELAEVLRLERVS